MTQVSTFHAAGCLFGIDVALVQEVVRLPAITPVPLARPEIAGLVNLRGDVLTAIDLRTRLGLAPSGGAREPVNVVVRLDDEAMSLLVDDVSGVLDLSRTPLEPPPATVDERLRGLLLGVHVLPDALLLVLNARAVLAVGEYRRPAA